MGTPISPVTLDPVAFVLGGATVSETALAPEQRRDILTEVLRRVKPHLKYLPQLKVFSKEARFAPRHPWSGARVETFLPSDMSKDTRCLCLASRLSTSQERHVFITRSGRLFWLLAEPRELTPGGRPGAVFQSASWIDNEGLLYLVKDSRVARCIISELHHVFGKAVDLRRARLSGTGLTLQKRQERLTSVERLRDYLGGILSRMT